jgi:hypothetical protein
MAQESESPASSPPPKSAEGVQPANEPSLKDLVPNLDLGREKPRKQEDDDLPEWTKQLPEEKQAQPGTEPPNQPPQQRQLRFTEEELEQIKKEKNWLIEEWKAHEEKRAKLEAELASEKEQSLIDEILKNYEEDINSEVRESEGEEESSDPVMTLAPSLPPVAWKDETRSSAAGSLDDANELATLFGDEADSTLDNFESETDTASANDSTTSSPTEFISPQSPLLGDQNEPAASESPGRLQLQAENFPGDNLAFNTDSEPFNPNEPYRPVVDAPGSLGSSDSSLPGNAYLPPEEWPTWRQNPNQTESAADRIAWLQRQEQQRQQEERRNRPTIKDLDPIQKKLRGSSSRFD